MGGAIKMCRMQCRSQNDISKLTDDGIELHAHFSRQDRASRRYGYHCSPTDALEPKILVWTHAVAAIAAAGVFTVVFVARDLFSAKRPRPGSGERGKRTRPGRDNHFVYSRRGHAALTEENAVALLKMPEEAPPVLLGGPDQDVCDNLVRYAHD